MMMATSATVRREPAVASDDADDRAAAFLGQLQRGDEVRADVFFHVAAADREHEQAILFVERLPLSHSTNTLGPAFVVGAGGQFADVVGRGVAFHPGDLAEIVDRVRSVRRAAADAQDEEPTAALAHWRKSSTARSQRRGVDFGNDFGSFAQVLFGISVLMGWSVSA